MTSEIAQVKQIFVNYQIPLSMEWLESCIEWCKSDNLPSNYTIKTLQNMVYEQWLILDIREVEIASLPKNLSLEKKYVLNGIFYVQVMQIIDISKPKLWQLQRIRNKVGKNTENEKDFGKRVLQLTLTDGVQEVEAMEFKPCPCLNINTKPGTKLKIIGPVTLRRGRLMLEQKNVSNLGGSVDEILIHNAAENVLARALRLEENPNPHEIDERVLEVEQANNTNAQFNVIVNQERNIIQNQPRTAPKNNQISNQRTTNNQIPSDFEVDDELLRELEEDFEENTTGPSTLQNVIVNTRSASPDLFEEMQIDDDLLNEHLNQMDVDFNEKSTPTSKIERPSGKLDRLESTSSKNPRDTGQYSLQEQSTTSEVITLDDSFDDIDIDMHLDNIDKQMASVPCSTQKVSDIKSPILKPKLTLNKAAALKKMTQTKLTFGNFNKNKNLNNDNDDGDFDNPLSNKSSSECRSGPSSFKKPEISPKLLSPEMPNNITQQSTIVSQCSIGFPKVNIMPIEKLKKLIPNITKGKFKIKGKFNKVAEKLQATETNYYLVINVVDSTGELTVELHSDLVTSFAKVRPQQLAKLKGLALKNDAKACAEVLQILKTLHAKCISLNCVMELEITRGQKHPVAINMIEVRLLYSVCPELVMNVLILYRNYKRYKKGLGNNMPLKIFEIALRKIEMLN